MNKDNIQKPPSFFEMAKTFSKELVTYMAHGRPNVSQADYEQRLNTCKTCPHLIEQSKRCGLCGCLLEHKAKWKTTDCPDKPSKWKKQILNNDKRQENNNTNPSNKV
jgi:hypothetical protein